MNHETAVKATETAYNSYGSAAKEQEQYNQSLEARINRLQTAWYGLADAVGNSILYDGIVTATSLLESITKAGDNVTGISLGFSSVVGVIGTGLTLLSGRFTGFLGEIIKTTAQTRLQEGANKGLATSFYTVAGASTVAGTAIRTALISTGVGIGIVAITSLLTLLINKFSETKQASEEFDAYFNKNSEAITTNRAEVERLVNEYNNLNEARKKGNLSAEDEQKYVDVQNQLAQLFPAIVASTDARGNAHIKSVDAINKEVEATQKLLDAENRLKIASANDNFKDLGNDIDKLERKKTALDKVLKVSINEGDSQKQLEEIRFNIAKTEKEIADKSAEIRSNVLEIADAFTDSGAKINEAINSEINNSLDSLDFSKLNPEELTNFAEKLSELKVKLSEAFDSGDEQAVAELNKELLNLYATTNDFNPQLTGTVVAFEKLKEAVDLENKLKPLDESLEGTGTSAEELANKIEDLANSINKLDSVEEQLAGVSSASVESSEELLFLYEQLTSRLQGYHDQELQELLDKPRLTAEEKNVVQALLQRNDVLQQLAVIYPQLAQLEGESISLSADKVEAIRKEEEANKALLEGYKLASEGKLTAEQTATLNQASGTKARINNIKAEILALNALIAQYEDTANKALTAQQFIDKVQDGSLQASNSSFYLPGVTEKNIKKKIGSLELELSSAGSTLDGLVSSINTTIDSVGSGSKSSKSKSKASTKATTESIYVTDKYKQAIEELSVAIAKQQKLQGDYPNYTAKYRSAIESEIKLQKQKLDLINSQTKALDAQIKSGKIAQTGNVTISNGTSKSNTNTVTKVSGSGSIQQQVFSYFKSKGLSDAAVAGILGNIQVESGFKTNAKNPNGGAYGLVQYLGSRKTGLQNFAKSRGTSSSDLQTQLDYIYKELQSTESKALKALQTAGKTPAEYANLFDKYFERSERTTIGARQSYANKYYQQFAGTAGSSVVTSSGSGAVATGAQAVDQAKSDLASLQQEALRQQELIADLEQKIIDSNISYFRYKENLLDKDASLQQARIANVDRADSKYNKILDYQLLLLQKKQDYNQREITYYNELIRKGKLNEIQLDEIKANLVEAETSLRAVNTEIQKFRLDRIVSEFEHLVEVSNQLVNIENARLDVLNQSSPKYRQTLETINKGYLNQKKATEDYIVSLTNLIKIEKLNGETLEETSAKLKEARVQLLELESQISKGNYDIIVNIQTNADEAIDDLDFEINREKEFRESYVEGSANYQNSIKKEIELLQKQADIKLKLYESQEKELKNLSLTAEDYKAVTESLEDTEIQYYSLLNAIKSLTKESENARKEQLSKIADDAISALKEYYQQRQEETDKAYEEELKQAEKRHKAIVDQLNEERDLFRRNVEERLELIDRTEAERSYNMEIDELEKQRNELQDLYNTYELDNSKEAKKKRKDLQKQLDDIDKEIAERRHDRDIELQKQALNDLLEDKEEEIDGQIDLEEERYNSTVESINKEREYWNQYFTDLLNDQRKFNKIREDILNGHFDTILNEFEGYAQELESTMYKLENTLDGTMEAVGTAIRQNVIDNLREAIKLAGDFNTSQDANSSVNLDSLVTSPRDPNAGKSNLKDVEEFEPKSDTRNFTNPDYKVLMAKYFREYLVKANGVNAGTIEALKAKGDSLAKQGRDQGSIIQPTETLNSALAELSPQQKTEFKAYVNENAGKYLTQQSLVNNIKNWAARLDTGGYLNFKGAGIDGKGGKAIIGHPDELILNKNETNAFFDSIKVNEGITATLANVINSLGNFAKSAVSTVSTNYGNINIQTGDVITESKDSAINFFNEVGDLIRTQNGGWR